MSPPELPTTNSACLVHTCTVILPTLFCDIRGSCVSTTSILLRSLYRRPVLNRYTASTPAAVNAQTSHRMPLPVRLPRGAACIFTYHCRYLPCLISSRSTARILPPACLATRTRLPAASSYSLACLPYISPAERGTVYCSAALRRAACAPAPHHHQPSPHHRPTSSPTARQTPPPAQRIAVWANALCFVPLVVGDDMATCRIALCCLRLKPLLFSTASTRQHSSPQSFPTSCILITAILRHYEHVINVAICVC